MASKSASEEKDQRVKGMMESLKKPKGTFRSMRIQAANNGYSVDTERDEPPESKKEESAEGDSPQLATPSAPKLPDVFKTKAEIHAHIDKHLPD